MEEQGRECGTEQIKQKAAYHAVDSILQTSMKIGIGSGTTVSWVIKRIAEHLGTGKIKDILAVSSSYDTQYLCRKHGISTLSMNDLQIAGTLDLCFDGADEVADDGALIKGGGGAHTREKILIYSSERFICVIDSAKAVPSIGAFPVPLEVLPEALSSVQRSVEAMGAIGTVRSSGGKLGPVISDNGNFIVDVKFPFINDPESLELELNAIPGVLENGIFTRQQNMQVFIGNKSGVSTRMY